jgi:phenylacetate-coenzyme A ligase PaaK-like adenylate-forming protein
MRPGGLNLTTRLLGLCALPEAARVLDVGCGNGQTVQYLHEKRGADAWGIDVEPGAGERLLAGPAEALPFEAGSFDAMLFECSLSVVHDPDAALGEAARVLKPEGVVYIADLYAQGQPAEFSGILGRVEPWETLVARFANAGFRVLCFEDQSTELLSYWARLLFDDSDGAAGCLPPGFRGGYFIGVLERELFTLKTLMEYQQTRRREAVKRAEDNSAFYREHGAAFTDGGTLIAQGERMLCVPLGYVSRVRTMQTSGSTGAPKRVWFTDADLERTVTFFSQGMRPLVYEAETCVIMMSRDTPGSVADLLRRGLARNGVCSVIHGAIQDPQAADAAMGAACLVGLPAELFWLCRHAPQLRPKTVLLSADYVSDSIIKGIAETWGCQVFTHYGMTETCYGLAVQCCAREGHHIRLDDYMVEIIDPRTGAEVLPGCEGEIVLTSLSSQAMPLIRYRTGDIGSLVVGRCGCGSILPRLGKIRGRREYLENKLNIHRMDDIMYALPGIKGYRAALDGDVLLLTVEGGAVDQRMLSGTFGVETQVSYGPVLPYIGKRVIERKFTS